MVPSILLFAPSCYPASGPEALVTAKLVRAMVWAGWHVDVISQRSGVRPYDPDVTGLFDAVRARTIVLDEPAGWRVRNPARWVRAAASMGHPLPGLEWAQAAYHSAKSMLHRRNYDAILSRSPPYYGHLPALALARTTSIPWIVNWNDPEPARRQPPPIGDGQFTAVRWNIDRFHRAVAGRAACHTFPSDRLLRYVREYLHLPPATGCCVLPHIGLGLAERGYAKRNETFTLSHCGILRGGGRSDRVLLEGLRLYLDTAPPGTEVALRLVGDVAGETRMRVRSLNLLENVSIEGAVSYTESLAVLRYSDVGVVVEAPAAEGIFLPSKVIDIADIGLPILALTPAPSCVRDLLAAHGGGVAVSPVSVPETAAAIRRLHAAWKRQQIHALWPTARLAENFSTASVLDRLARIIEGLAQRRSTTSPRDRRLAART